MPLPAWASGGACQTATVPHPPLALTYHGVADVSLREDIHRAYARPADLRRQIGQLRGWGYELLTFSDWAARVSADGGSACAALTFDDGFSDNLHVLLPLLRELEAPATVFAVSGWLGQRHPHTPRARVLTASELCELHSAGIEVGAHTRTHPDLRGLSSEAARDEMAGGQAELEDILGAPVGAFAYPYGAATPETVGVAREVGFTAACRALGLGRWDDPHDLPRQDMGNRSSALGLRLKRDNRYVPLMRLRPVRVLRRARLAAHGAPLRRLAKSSSGRYKPA
jgi:peptidoglycan/xylan/chitin deacetylase (PgdA/CDA1 family)